MGWMNDSLRYMGREPVYRQFHHHEMTFAMAYAYSENFILPISHDEVVHGKGSMFERAPQDEWRKFGTLRAFYAFMWAHPGKKLLFMGTEFGQRREFSESRSIDWWQSAGMGPPRRAAADQGSQRHLQGAPCAVEARHWTHQVSPGSTPTIAAETSSPGSATTATVR